MRLAAQWGVRLAAQGGSKMSAMRYLLPILFFLCQVFVGCAPPKRTGNDLMAAVVVKDLEGVKAVLDTGTPADERDDNGSTALFVASRAGYRKIVALLLERGADHSLVDKKFQKTPLQGAVMMGHLEVVKMLLQKGAKAKAEHVELAQKSKHEKLAEFLRKEFQK